MKYVQACAHSAWHLEIWPKDRSTDSIIVPFACRSWRHEGPCRLWKGAQDFVRIKEAMSQHAYWMHCVLTYPRKRYKNIKHLFRLGLKHWAMLRKRLQRRYGDYKYIQTWEVTRKKIPHCHMAISNRRMWHDCEPDPIGNFHRLMQEHAAEVGFGPIGWLEKLESTAAVAGYLGKLSRELTGKGKAYQIPVDAPSHFRRLRASVRLLPPVRKNDDYTGELWRCTEDGEVIELPR